MKAKNIMTRKLITVTRDTTIEEAIRLMIEHSISGLPVIDESMGLVGVISEKDVLKFLIEGSLHGVVSEVMSTKVVSFDQDEDIHAVCRSFIDNSFRRVPIVCKGKIVGIISRRDVMRLLLEMNKAPDL